MNKRLSIIIIIISALLGLLTVLVIGCIKDLSSPPSAIIKAIPDDEFHAESVQSIEDNLQIDTFSYAGTTYYFYCNTKTGEVRMRSVNTERAIFPDSKANIQKMIEEYRNLPEGDRMRLGGGFREHLIHIGHDGRSGNMTFGETSFLIIGDQDDPEHGDIRIAPNFKPDFIYTPCAPTAPKPASDGDK